MAVCHEVLESSDFFFKSPHFFHSPTLGEFSFPVLPGSGYNNMWYEEWKKLLDFFSLHVHILYNLMDPDTAFSRFQETIRQSSPSCLPTSRVSI